MQIIKTVEEMQSMAIRWRGKGKLLGLVPTMGALHEGHFSLMDVAREKADILIVSLFVNPTQFGPNEDYKNYPRTLEEDIRRCEERGVDIVFAPAVSDIYPPDFSTFVEETSLSAGLCGASRPGHFRGVTTIVNILFNVCRPDVAVFGQKDAQQAAVLRKMVRDLHLPIDVVTAPTMREPDGLAMSSRNSYLDSTQRRGAAKIYEALQIGERLVQNGTLSVDRVKAEVTHHLGLTHKMRIIYVEIVDKDTMVPERQVRSGHSILVVAVWLEQIRLIDNIAL